MHMENRLKGVLILGVSLVLAACSSAPKVDRIDADSTTDLSGDWNDTDSRLVGQAMVEQALSHPWISDFIRANGHQPAVIVGDIRNLSHEHISVTTFVNDIERALINSGRVNFVASSGERDQVRDERRDQDLHASERTRNPAGRERGADFMLKGTISTIYDTVNKKQTRFYQVDLSLISLADNSKVWIGQKKIKKAVENPQVRF